MRRRPWPILSALTDLLVGLRCIAKLDVDGDGSVDLQEFVERMGAIRRRQLHHAPALQLQVAFGQGEAGAVLLALPVEQLAELHADEPRPPLPQVVAALEDQPRLARQRRQVQILDPLAPPVVRLGADGERVVGIGAAHDELVRVVQRRARARRARTTTRRNSE